MATWCSQPVLTDSKTLSYITNSTPT
uniref:Uncharacterized protein n=1 Tax=Anguilla anguilla TaxID=7936 RepID=A0A0E9VMQ4_ANGAN